MSIQSVIQTKADLPPVQDRRPIPIILALHLAITSVFNFVGAIVGTYAMHMGGTFYENLVFSICIGTLAFLLIDGGRLILWGRGMPPRLPFIMLVIVAMPIAKFVGNSIAIRMLGLDAEAVIAHQAQNATATLILTALSCVIITWFFWRRGEVATLKATIEAEKARAAAIEKQALQAQLQMLQAQIEPHMLFNTLANLQALIAVDATRAQHMLDQLIQYLRATLSSSRAETTTLGQEFSLLEAYLGLMAVRMGSRLSYALHLPEDLRALPLPPMLLQPLVENAIKHGLEPKVDGGHIDVHATRNGNLLALSVIDDGLGLDAADSAGTQVGVANIRERLQALYRDRAAFSLVPNTPHGVTAQITIPL
jgi:signal transduction histidine kinase